MSAPRDPIPPAPSGLQQFLDEEVTLDALEHLLEKALASRQNRWVEPYSGNAYSVEFDDEQVLIAHHYVADWPAVRMSLDEFIARLEAWSNTLTYLLARQ